MADPQDPQGVVSALQDLDYGIAGAERVTYATAFLNATASGNTQLVALVAGRRIRVLAALVTNNGAAVIAVKFQSATTDITATHDAAADGGGFNIPPSQGFYCQTVAGEALNFNLSGVGTVGVDIGYVLV
jgi:hypothetical protein